MPVIFDGQEQPLSQSNVWLRDEPPRALNFRKGCFDQSAEVWSDAQGQLLASTHRMVYYRN